MAEINETNLLAAGYRRYNSDGLWPHVSHFFQKRMYSATGNGTKYFIDVKCYPAARYGSHDLSETFEAEVRFEMETGKPYVRVSIGNTDIETIETLADKLWVCAGGTMYENDV